MRDGYGPVGRWLRSGVFALGLISSAACAASGEFDGGGRLGDYIDGVAAANRDDAPVRIGGVCASACTAKLGARNVCVHPDAQLWFHAASDPDGRIDKLGTLLLLSHYPRALRAWAMRRRALETMRFTVLGGAEAIALGVRACPEASPAAARRPAIRRSGNR